MLAVAEGVNRVKRKWTATVRVNTVNPLRQAHTPKMGGLVYSTLLWETVHQCDGLLMGDRARLIICVFLLLSGTLRSLSDIFYIWSAGEPNKLSLRSIKRQKLQSDNARYCSTAHTQAELELCDLISHMCYTHCTWNTTDDYLHATWLHTPFGISIFHQNCRWNMTNPFRPP